MTDQVPSGAQQGGTPPVSNPAAAGTPPATPPVVLKPEALVTVTVDGKRFDEPVSKVVASYQMQSAAEKRLADAKALLESRRDQVTFAERFQQQLEKDPEAVLEEISRVASERHGRKIRPRGWNDPASDPGLGTGTGDPASATSQDPAVARKLRELESTVASLQQTSVERNRDTEVKSALDQYTILTATDEAGKRMRGFAENALKAMKAQNPSASFADLASELHAGLQGLATAKATAERDASVARASALAGIPAGAGTPGLTDREPPPTYADFKKPGAIREKLERFYGQVQRGLSANR